jgi:undecaprenyl-diphosphatase
MAIVSRLGDGWIWGLLLLAAWGWAAHALAWALLISGVCSTATYVAIKHACNRSRPCERSSQFDVPVLPLDRWSFPSGHTMHAVAFTVVFAATVPTALLALAPFTLLVMLSRVVLGLHYPSDVFAGGCGGLLSGYFALQLVA